MIEVQKLSMIITEMKGPEITERSKKRILHNNKDEKKIEEEYSSEVPFLWIGEVKVGSPGEEAGLLYGDPIVKFDSVDHRTPDFL